MNHIPLSLAKAFTLIEPGPVALLTTHLGGKSNLMTFSWHMVLDFSPRFALVTGPWNYSYEAIIRTKECVIAIPTVDLMRKVIGVGTTTGAEVDKFTKFKLTPQEAKTVKAPLVGECYANIECRIADHLIPYNIFVLEATAAWIDHNREEKRIFHYRGDGVFVADGDTFDHRRLMKEKLAPVFQK